MFEDHVLRCCNFCRPTAEMQICLQNHYGHKDLVHLLQACCRDALQIYFRKPAAVSDLFAELLQSKGPDATSVGLLQRCSAELLTELLWSRKSKATPADLLERCLADLFAESLRRPDATSADLLQKCFADLIQSRRPDASSADLLQKCFADLITESLRRPDATSADLLQKCLTDLICGSVVCSRVVAESCKLNQVGYADRQWFKRIPLALLNSSLALLYCFKLSPRTVSLPV